MNTKIITILTSLVLLCSFIPVNTKPLIEKTYTQTDRSLYFPGETVWFKTQIVNANNSPSSISHVLHAQLIAPNGSVAKTLQLKIKNGYAYGNFDIAKDQLGGIYTIKTFTNFMKNQGDESFFKKQITIQRIVKPRLLMKVKFQEKSYGPNSHVTLKATIKDLKNKPLSNHTVSYKVTISGKDFITKPITLNKDGKANIIFSLPENLKSTDVVCNIIIPYKGSQESISRAVPVILDTIDLQFFPESGKTIKGTTNTIAFKALNEFGKPTDLSGIIVDKKGNTITTFKSYHDGMGTVQLNPNQNQYYAIIKQPFLSKRRIALPKIYDEGITFTCTNDQVKIYSTRQRKVTLIAKKNNQILFQRALQLNKGLTTHALNTGYYKAGIVNILIEDEANTPLAERLLFINNHKQLNIDIKTEKSTYQTRSKVKVHIKTTDYNQHPVTANLAIGIADNKIISFADDKQDNILTYLLLSSELKGKIHEPAFYFNPEEPKAKKAIDLLMLTHGWRNYIKKPITTINKDMYQPERLEIQSGQVRTKDNKPITAKLILFNTRDKKAAVFNTDAHGNFSFHIKKRRSYTLLAYRDDAQHVIIHNNKIASPVTANKEDATLDRAVSPLKPTMFQLAQDPNLVKKKSNKTSANSFNQKSNLNLNPNASALSEVVVTAHGIKREKKALGYAVTSVGAERLSATPDIARLLQGKASGVQISNAASGSSPNIRIRGISSVSSDNDPLIIMDGIPLLDSTTLMNINPDQIESLTVLKGNLFNTCSPRSNNGAIIITTKKYYRKMKSMKRPCNFRYKNHDLHTYYRSQSKFKFNTVKEFYTPVYEGSNLPTERTDFRNTLYWNPVIETNTKGEATFEFYTSDAISSFKITAEGISATGLVGRQEQDFASKKLLNIDFKLPNYLTVNDEVIIPVTVTNDNEEDFNGTIQLNLPKSIKLVSPIDKTVCVPSHSYQIINIKVQPIRATKRAIIGININDDFIGDNIKREATIISPYFPITASISGTKNESYSVDINNVLPNSIEAKFTVYTDIIGSVMDGIEGIIRAPYGCFEQVSSATYPNIMVLQYLKSTGKSNKAIEEKALSFIDKGYKKLAAYETKQHGFEWYGDTPPHEALSAYGLLEFSEMKAVYGGVDQKMLDRTIAWLLSRRNGKGGFKQNRGKYGFSAAPKEVNNAYIVYAMTETGITHQIKKEYHHAFKEALKSNDAYRMALLACASVNMNQPKQAELLINKIKKQIQNKGFNALKVNQTITRSYGDAKKIETLAFSLLALMKMPNPDMTLVAKGVQQLVSMRKHGRFGSTQSTCMALKALITYTAIQKQQIIKDNTVTLTINGKVTNASLDHAADGTLKINNLEPYIKTGRQDIKVQFNNAATSIPYSLDIHWKSTQPDSSRETKVQLNTQLNTTSVKVGDLIRLTTTVKNKTNDGLPMTTAIIGLPSGTSVQPWQLKKLKEEHQFAYYEIFDNYLVLYWKELGPNETKTIHLDLKAEIAGTYTAPASAAYLYYADEFKHWIPGTQATITP